MFRLPGNLSGISSPQRKHLRHGCLSSFRCVSWLGVFITGSDTSSNALFTIAGSTGRSIDVDPLITVGANITGGVVGKMISPQSIAVAAAAGNLVGKESDLFRFTVKHSFILLILICLITLLQAYVFTWLIPG
jgi:lactate permease